MSPYLKADQNRTVHAGWQVGPEAKRLRKEQAGKGKAAVPENRRLTIS
jgi:hypothetical protein